MRDAIAITLAESVEAGKRSGDEWQVMSESRSVLRDAWAALRVDGGGRRSGVGPKTRRPQAFGVIARRRRRCVARFCASFHSWHPLKVRQRAGEYSCTCVQTCYRFGT